jgi:hypothetical protein
MVAFVNCLGVSLNRAGHQLFGCEEKGMEVMEAVDSYTWDMLDKWAQGALTVLPQPQLQGASWTVIAARFEQAVSHSLNQFLRRFYTCWAFQVSTPCTPYVFYVGI